MNLLRNLEMKKSIPLLFGVLVNYIRLSCGEDHVISTVVTLMKNRNFIYINSKEIRPQHVYYLFI